MVIILRPRRTGVQRAGGLSNPFKNGNPGPGGSGRWRGLASYAFSLRRTERIPKQLIQFGAAEHGGV